jgi:hypothetical protein
MRWAYRAPRFTGRPAPWGLTACLRPVLTRWQGWRQHLVPANPPAGGALRPQRLACAELQPGTGSKDGPDKAVCERQGIPIPAADLAYQRGLPWVTTGVKRRPHHGLTPTRKTVNRALARTAPRPSVASPASNPGGSSVTPAAARTA